MPKPNPELKLYSVTLPWNKEDSSEGDYCNWVWAVDNTTAIRLIAEEMADSRDGGAPHDNEKERQKQIEFLISGGGTYCVEDVAVRVMADIELLLRGPDGVHSEQSQRAYGQIKALLVGDDSAPSKQARAKARI
jgi:hypothetical protein